MTGPVRLGIRANLAQFTLLVVVNAFVGAMVGLERTLLPAIAEHDFHLAARTAILSFIVVFGVTKALTNYFAGRLSDAVGRKRDPRRWLARGRAGPVPADVGAVVELGARGQRAARHEPGPHLVDDGDRRRSTSPARSSAAWRWASTSSPATSPSPASALATGHLAAVYGLRPQPFYLGIAFVVIGLALSALLVRETHGHAHHEASKQAEAPVLSQRAVFLRTSFTDRELSSVSQAGLVNNLNDGMAWGLFPIFFAAAHMTLAQIGYLAAIYPAAWGVGQLFTGALSDRLGRKWLIAAGMWVQAAGIAVIVSRASLRRLRRRWHPARRRHRDGVPDAARRDRRRRAPALARLAVGVYRLWRDLGYAIGALVAGITADALGIDKAIWLVAAHHLRVGPRRRRSHARDAPSTRLGLSRGSACATTSHASKPVTFAAEVPFTVRR